MTYLLPATTPTAPPMIGAWALNTVQQADALDLLRGLPSGSVDAIITDLPYGTTACSWDEIIPFDSMWAGVKRVLKPRGVFVTTASQPFTSKLVMSNLDWFKYEWIWNKTIPVDFLNVKLRPMRLHENILVFAPQSYTYNPQYRDAKDVVITFGKLSRGQSVNYSSYGDKKREGVGYPLSIIKFPRPNNLSDGGHHPTQKPVALFRYLIRTYTQPGDLVVDFCCGSGTTALAAREENRQFIGGDQSAEYVAIARRRLAEPYTPNFMPWLEQLDAVQEAVG